MALPKRHSGVSMLEVLIAILILSLGLLGMLGVLLNSIKLTSSSNYRSIAAEQANAMADSIRANISSLSAYNSPASALTAGCLSSSGCTRAQLVSNDLYVWQSRLGALLPSGAGTVCRDDTPGDGGPANWQCSGVGIYVVKICWSEARVAISGATTCVWANI